MWQKTKNIYHLLVAILANTYFRFPGRKLKIIGITGTDGKTTTASLIYHILKTSGKNASLISTVGAYIGDTTYDTGFHVTNPASIPLQQFLKRIVYLGTGNTENYLVLEVTSHGIDQNRIWGIPFTIAGLTNITHEHLDYHKTYENYVATKARLLQKAQIAVVNKDDDSYLFVKKILKGYRPNGKKLITYGLKNADVTPSTIAFKTALPGKYNLYNCLLAATICRQLGVSEKDIQKGIARFVLPQGRAEVVYNKNFTVMIDFAHTPNAFDKLLSALKVTVKGRLIHVFGAAGERDASKRPLMGKASSQFADVIILTAEDPRSEKIEDINQQIRSHIHNFGFSSVNQKNIFPLERGKKYLFEIPDRQKAIIAAISMAQKGDFIVITGKAHEKSMNYGKGEVPWSDHEAVEKALQIRLGK